MKGQRYMDYPAIIVRWYRRDNMFDFKIKKMFKADYLWVKGISRIKIAIPNNRKKDKV